MTSPSVAPESPDLMARIDALFADIEAEVSPGCALAVVRGGEVIHARGYGLADLEHQISMPPAVVRGSVDSRRRFSHDVLTTGKRCLAV